MHQQKETEMTTRVKYSESFRGWTVEYYNAYTDVWHIHEGYYPKAGMDVFASFRTREEAEEYNEYINRPQPVYHLSNEVPADYYGVKGRYYGD